MKAVIIRKFGSAKVLELTDSANIPEPKKNQVLIKVFAAGVNPLDWKVRNGLLKFVPGVSFPLILGNDAAGIVVKCGSEVKNFHVGDSVFCMLDAFSKPSLFRFAKSGAYAEYAITREDTLVLKPESLSYEEAASIPLSALTAYQSLTYLARIRPGSKVLLLGATGGTGIFAVQIAKYLGADITAVCSSENFELAKSLGAERLLDRKTFSPKDLSEKYDIIYDIAVSSSFYSSQKILTNSGAYITNVANVSSMLFLWFGFILRIFGYKKRNLHAWVMPSGNDLQKITEIIREGKLRTVLDTIYPIEDVDKAHNQSEFGKVRGKLVLKPGT